MKISEIESFVLKVPIGARIEDSMQSVIDLEFAGVIISTDGGISGTGYTVTVGYGGSVIQNIIDTLYSSDLTGRDPFDVKAIWNDLYYGKAHWIGRTGATAMAQAAVDIALWDIIAKSADKPLWQVLGCARKSNIPIYNTHAGWLNYSIDQLRNEALKLIGQGYTALKMKVGLQDIREDYRRICAVRKAIGDDILLMVDANQKWDLMKAGQAVNMFADMDLTWVEEPLHPDDIKAHKILHARSSIPIALANISIQPSHSGIILKILQWT